jgi:hypothetical protein
MCSKTDAVAGLFRVPDQVPSPGIGCDKSGNRR